MLVVSPAFSRFNAANGVLKNAVVNRYFALQSVVFAYFFDLLQSKFRSAATFTSVCRAVAYSVSLVVFWCVPAKIFEAVILRISVVMAAFFPSWPLADKRFQDQRVRFSVFGLVVSPKKQKNTPVLFVKREFLELSAKFRPDVPTVRNLINTFKTHYVAPFFHSFSHTYPTGIL